MIAPHRVAVVGVTPRSRVRAIEDSFDPLGQRRVSGPRNTGTVRSLTADRSQPWAPGRTRPLAERAGRRWRAPDTTASLWPTSR